MLGGDSFVKAGWVHHLRAHLFKHSSGDRWIVMGKVCLGTTKLSIFIKKYSHAGETLPKNVSSSSHTLGCVPTHWGNYLCTLYMHGRVSMHHK